MSNSLVLEAIRRQQPWAEVRAHDQVMRYRRFGAGRPLLLLESGVDGALIAELSHALAESHRLIVPQLPGRDVHLASWLADFLEGLGCSRLGIIAAEPFCLAVLELALLGNDQIGHIVLIADSQSEHGRSRLAEPGLLEGATSRVSVPVLLVRCGLTMDEAVRLVRDFLWDG